MLDLVLERGCTVQPWYLEDPERASTPYEHQAMKAIRDALARRAPAAAARILSLHVRSTADVRSDSELTGWYHALRIGSQYDWLARLARQQGLDALERCVEKRDSRVHRMLWSNTTPVRGAGGETYRLRPEVDDPDLGLLRHFAFPVLHLTKQDLRAAARRAGFLDHMQTTWYCHDPRNGRPCGSCAPCLIASEEGMGGDIPLFRHTRGRLRLLNKSPLSPGL